VDADGERYFAAANVSVPAGGKRRRVERVGSAAEVLASGESGGGGGDGGFFVTGWEKGVEAEFAEGRRSSSSRAEESVGDPRATKIDLRATKRTSAIFGRRRRTVGLGKKNGVRAGRREPGCLVMRGEVMRRFCSSVPSLGVSGMHLFR
ncbi:unnamed protein product, partial [Ascophyllum nodosum]